MNTLDQSDIRDLVRQARRLDLIDAWAEFESGILVSVGSISYCVNAADSAAFLRSLIRRCQRDVPGEAA